MKTHDLKTWPEYFSEIFIGHKTFELRKNDRDFKVGDTLSLMEYIPEPRTYTGNTLKAKVTYVLEGGRFGLEKGYVIMGIKVTEHLGFDPASVVESTISTVFITPECERSSSPQTLEDKFNSLEQRLDTVWTEVFSGGVGQIAPSPKFRTTLKGTVDDLCAQAGLPPVSSPWFKAKDKE